MKGDAIIFIVGPTAVGKTAIAVALAKRINGEIFSCDSMQVYKELQIISGKPAPQERRKVPHHLLDIVSVTESFDAAQFCTAALNAMDDIKKRKRVPILAGGSGLYMQVLLDGIFEGPGRDQVLRQEWEAVVKARGHEYVYEQLRKADPEAAAKIHPHNVKRVIRALEVCRKAGEKFSRVRTQRQGLWGRQPIHLFCLNRDREALYRRIDARVEEMFQEGAVKEVDQILSLPLSPALRQMIGIKEISGYLNGEYDLERAKEWMKQNTRRFAKRQFTWFRKDKRLVWHTIKNDETPSATADALIIKMKENPL